MRVKDLIELLSKQPQDALVLMDNECGCDSRTPSSVFIPDKIGRRYGKHTGIRNDRDVIICALEI